MDGSAKDSTIESDTPLMKFLLAIQRLQRSAIDLVTDQLAFLKIDDINAIQALILCSVGDEVSTAGGLKHNGHYQGSNVSYNLRKLIERGYMIHSRSETDARTVNVSLSEKGQELRTRLMQRIAKLSQNCEMRYLFPELVQQIDVICRELDGQIRYIR